MRLEGRDESILCELNTVGARKLRHQIVLVTWRRGSRGSLKMFKNNSRTSRIIKYMKRSLSSFYFGKEASSDRSWLDLGKRLSSLKNIGENV